MIDDLFGWAGKPLPDPVFTGHPSKHPAYQVLRGMKERCSSPAHASFARYGGRGITVCAEWLASPSVFIVWALSNGWKPGLQVDRIDNDGPYSPENCRIVTATENRLNTSRVHRLKDGRTAVLVAVENGLSESGFYRRLDAGWSIEDAVKPPRERPMLSDGRLALLVARQNGISSALLHQRLLAGWSVDLAATKPKRKIKPAKKT